jgi:RNA polymerase sigma-70 factor (ECF subfamily)
MDDDRARRVAGGLRTGDPDAWRELYDAYAERVWRGVARLLGPHPADVADIVQETMLAAARSARNFDESKGSLWNWLWGIARTQVSLHYRNRQRHDRWRQRSATWIESTDPTQATELESAELAEVVRTALGELPGDYEQLLTAKYLDGESVEGIAGRERTTETAVRSKLARARDAFRTAYLRLTRSGQQESEVARELP